MSSDENKMGLAKEN